LITSPDQCPSCGAPKRGPYCSDCGERFLSPADFDLRHFLLHDLPHDVWHVDGKLKRTLRALFLRPGLLPAEYTAGRRVAYIAPLRLYLVVFLVHLALVASSPDATRTLPDQAAMIDPTGLTVDLARARPQVQWSDPTLQEHLAERERWGAEFGTILIFLGVGGVLQLLFYRQHRRYLEHAVLALSITTWYLLLVSVGEFALMLMRSRQYVASDLQLATWLAPTLAVYGWFAFRRFYGASRLYATLAAVVLLVSQGLIAMILNLAVIALLLVTA
jgi:Protein of unknown function (DUF3667)